MVQITFFTTVAFLAASVTAVPVAPQGFPGAGMQMMGGPGKPIPAVRPAFGTSVFRREYDTSLNERCVCRPDIMTGCVCGGDLDAFQSFARPGMSPAAVARELVDEVLAAREENQGVVGGISTVTDTPFGGGALSKIGQFVTGVLFGKRQVVGGISTVTDTPFGGGVLSKIGQFVTGLFGKRQVVGGISTVTDTPFGGGVFSKIGQFVTGLFGKRQVVGGISTVTDTPFGGGIASKALQFIGGLFGKRQTIQGVTTVTGTPFGGSVLSKVGKFVGEAIFGRDLEAADLFTREFVDAINERCVCRPDIPNSCVCGGPASIGLQRPGVMPLAPL